jgi:hypothetical protein
MKSSPRSLLGDIDLDNGLQRALAKAAEAVGAAIKIVKGGLFPVAGRRQGHQSGVAGGYAAAAAAAAVLIDLGCERLVVHDFFPPQGSSNCFQLPRLMRGP